MRRLCSGGVDTIAVEASPTRCLGAAAQATRRKILSLARLSSPDSHHLHQNGLHLPPNPHRSNANTLQAPIKPSKRSPKASRPSARTPAAISLQPKKKAKLQARHTTFITKIEKSATKNAARSRRRQKKAAAQSLVAGLESLADALDDAVVVSSVGFQSGSSRAVADGRKSMKSRPGAMKRKEKVVKSECERFGKNLAIMQTGLAGEGEGGKKPSSWAALRGFIEGTMEKKEEFVEAGVVVEE